MRLVGRRPFLLINPIALQHHLTNCNKLQLIRQALIAHIKSLILFQYLHGAAHLDEPILNSHLGGILTLHEFLEELLLVLVYFYPLFCLTDDRELRRDTAVGARWSGEGERE